ncbi:MAG: hypothetical protein H7832_04165 [Magnetococcus sp. DMHC-6]
MIFSLFNVQNFPLHWIRRIQIFLTVLTLACFIGLDLSIIKPIPVSADARDNLGAAYHLYKDGIFSRAKPTIETGESAEITPDNWRGPVVPMLLSVWLHWTDPGGDLVLGCLQKPYPGEKMFPCADPEKGKRWLERIFLFNILFLLILLIATFYAGWLVTGGWFFGYLAMVIIGLNSFMLQQVLTVMTDLHAAVWTILSALFLRMVFYSRRKILFAFLSGFFMALLILTKEIFIYFFVLVVICAVIVFVFRSTLRRSAIIVPVLAFLVPVLLLDGAWIWRNYNQFDTLQISTSRGAISARAEYLAMNWREFWVGFLYYIPNDLIPYRFRGDGLFVEKFFPRADFAHLMDTHDQNSFYRRINKPDGLVWRTTVQRTGNPTPDLETREAIARSLILESPLKNLALSIHLGFKGLFLPVGLFFQEQELLADPWVASVRYWTIHYMPFMMPSLFICTWIFLRRRDMPTLLFLSPAIYSFLIHAGATNYIVRFNAPILPIVAIGFVTLVSILWQRLQLNVFKAV